MFKKLIGSKAFYKAVFAIALPLIIQNVITNFVNLLDNIMVGQLGTAQMSGVSVVNQLIFIFNLAVFGISAGAVLVDIYQFSGKEPNVWICSKLKPQVYKDYIFRTLHA